MGVRTRKLTGTVECDGVGISRGFQKFIEKRIEQWLDARGIVGFPRFHAVFSRAGTGHAVHCYLQIRLGNRLWSGDLFANGPFEALKQCLDRLSVLPGSTVRRPLASVNYYLN